jgi:RNA polymerase sigma-70 factor, ECF subfamily
MLLYPPGSGGSIPDARLTSRPQPEPLPQGLVGIHYALRRDLEKTVMRLRKAQVPVPYPDACASASPEERKALDAMFSATYEELRRLASSVKRDDPNSTLTPTSLVNEAWIKLARSPRFADTSQLHFKRIAARAMRQVLVEAARRRHADKRGGSDAIMVALIDDSLQPIAGCGQDLLALHRALEELARIEPRQALMVESRFFGGLDVHETATLLDVSEATVLRDWRAAKAWLAQEMRRAE